MRIKHKNNNWIYIVFVITFILSMIFSVVSNIAVNNLNIFFALIVLFIIITIGIIFDIIGIAFASSDIAPFTAKASRKHKGAKEAIYLLRNADKVSNICNDIVGDICGIISGAAGVVIAIKLANILNLHITIVTLLIGSAIASITVVGKALGKTYAINKSTRIIYKVGIIMHVLYKKTK